MSRCWAYSLDGRRCEAEGDHDRHLATWSDEECLVPGATVTPAPPGPAVAVVRTMPKACLVCEHTFHGSSSCRATIEGGPECGCFGVPA